MISSSLNFTSNQPVPTRTMGQGNGQHSQPVLFQPAKAAFSPALPHFSGELESDTTNLSPKKHADHRSIAYSRFASREASDDYLSHVLGRFLKKDDTILEIGCNSGNNLLALGKQYKMYGLDLDGKLVNQLNASAQAQGLEKRVKSAQCDIVEDQPLPSNWPDLKGKCKAIYAVHTLSHFSDDGLKKLVQKLKPYLAPGGVVMVTIIDPEAQAISSRKQTGLLKIVQEVKGRPAIAGGLESHDSSVVSEAFKDFRLVKAYSRPFESGELKHWRLPESRLRWAVYQLPETRLEQLQVYSNGFIERVKRNLNTTDRPSFLD